MVALQIVRPIGGAAASGGQVEAFHTSKTPGELVKQLSLYLLLAVSSTVLLGRSVLQLLAE